VTLVVGVLLFEEPAKDTWILQGILPFFLAFSFLLGIGILLGKAEFAAPNAAIALGLLAVIPSLKYEFVYGETDGLAHYSAALQIVQSGSLATQGFYAVEYAPTPLVHTLLAAIGVTSGLPIEAAIVCTLFLEHFIFLVLIAETVRTLFPQMDRRLIAFGTLITLPVLVEMTGTVYGLLGITLFVYFFARATRERETPAYWFLIAVILGLLLISHFPTTVYFMIAVIGYVASRFVTGFSSRRRSGFSNESERDLLTRLLPLFLVFFIAFLAFAGPFFSNLLRSLASTFFSTSVLPSTASRFTTTELFQLFLLENGRLLLSTLAAVVAMSTAMLRSRKTKIFFMFCWLLGSAVIIWGAIIASGLASVRSWTSFAYASLTAPYFLSLFVWGRMHRHRLLTIPRFPFWIRGVMVAILIASTVAAYPITPLYPHTNGNPILDDNSVNSIYTISGLQFFTAVYSQSRLITSVRIFHQLISLYPALSGKTISFELENVTSPAELVRELVLFDAGSRSGVSTLAMSSLVPHLKSKLGIVYSNGYFYIGLAT